MRDNIDLREQLAKGNTLSSFEDMSLKVQERFEGIANGDMEWIPPPEVADLPFPPWICQPYVRPLLVPPPNSRAPPISIPDSDSRVQQVQIRPDPAEEAEEEDDELYPEHRSKIIKLSRKRLKRMERNPRRNWAPKPKPPVLLCPHCVNPAVSSLNSLPI